VTTRTRIVMTGRWIRRCALGMVLISALVVGGTGIRVWQVARLDDREPADIVIVLGAAQYSGKPSAILEARLKHAKKLYDQGVVSYIVTSGGRQEGDRYTEADAGVRWLTARGLPPERVVGVGEGSDTLGSVRAVANVAKQRGWTSAVIVSDPWHSMRARTMARDEGLEAQSSPTHTGPTVQTRETQARYIVYETAALLYYRVLNAPADDVGVQVG
jgi:vancomycin permeability regulator SanA